MIFVLFAYGGWNEMAYVGAEVRDPQRRNLRALMLGTAAVTRHLRAGDPGLRPRPGAGRARNAKASGGRRAPTGPGRRGRPPISLLIYISAFGAINGMIFTGSRIYYAMGTDHRLYAWLGRWSPRGPTPARSLLMQAAITLALVVSFGLGGAKGVSKVW